MRYLFFILFFLCQDFAYSQDLLISSYSGPTTYARHAEFEHVFTIQYGGIVTITQIPSHSFYLSTDDQLDGSDYYIGYGEQDSYDLMPGDYTLVSMGYSSINITPGTYFLIYVIDPYNTIVETDEDNNKLVIAGVTITPPDIDFAFTDFSLDKSSYAPYEIIDPTYHIVNHGTTNAGDGLRTSFYLSLDNLLSDDDTYLDYDYNTLMGSDDTEDWIHFRLTTPNVALGDYYLIARTNYYPGATTTFEETDYLNNLETQLISIVSPPALDLTIQSAYLILINPEMGYIDGYGTIMNNSDISIGGYELEIQFRDSNGLPLTPYSNISSYDKLEPGFNSIYFSSYYPLPPGTYTYSLRINNNQAITETDYSNNEYVSTETIVISPPPFEQVTVNAISIPESFDNTDEEITLQLDLTNTGTDPSYVQYFGFEITDEGGNAVYYNETSTLINFDPGTSATQFIPLSLEEPLAIGNYILTILDRYPYNTIFEQTQTSFTIVPVQYNLTGTVKGEDGTSINKGKLFLYQKDNTGKVSFIQKITPYDGPSFNFNIDEHPHTLYFVPDPVLFPEYVPTIYGKSVTLSDANFFIPAADIDTVFRILKVNPLTSGTAYIHGVVFINDAGGRANGDGVPMAGAPVILLSATGEVVGMAYTNEEGYFEFLNLPHHTYQIVVSTELDFLALASPLMVDLTSANANVAITFTETGVETVIQEVVGTEDPLAAINGYPNPTHGKVKLTVAQPVAITVVNAVGNSAVSVPYKNEELDFTQVPAGIYLVKITSGQQTRVLKVIKN